VEYNEFVEYLTAPLNNKHQDYMHAVLGIVTEAGELADAMKKNLAYRKELDTVNIKEELGDLMFYIQMACNHFGFKLEDVIETNIRKLQRRYPEGFDTFRALNRDLIAEREELEDVQSD